MRRIMTHIHKGNWDRLTKSHFHYARLISAMHTVHSKRA